MDASARTYLSQLAAATSTVLGDALDGVYAHGSLALGGWRPERSDIDVLVVTGRRLTVDERTDLAAALAEEVLPCPAIGLELSVVTQADAGGSSPRPAFELHVTTAPQDTKVVDGHGHPGDPDLVLHAAICRASGLTVVGPDPASVFGPVPRDAVLRRLAEELDWAVEHAPAEYTVLNACRAWRCAVDGALVSKVDGGRWALGRLDDADRALVEDALAHQEARADAPTIDAGVAAAFARSRRGLVRAAT